jgi:ligand-binding SRPBCC domain-containing protein
MPTIRLETFIAAPPERVFDLMRDVDAHIRSTAGTGERAVGGKTTGLLGAGDEVTWEAVHLGVRQRLTVRVTLCERPTRFEDVQVRGAFAAFTHRHEFRATDGGTLMLDTFSYRSPLGPLGRLADLLFLERYMRGFLSRRAEALKQMAESRAGPGLPEATGRGASGEGDSGS